MIVILRIWLVSGLFGQTTHCGMMLLHYLHLDIVAEMVAYHEIHLIALALGMSLMALNPLKEKGRIRLFAILAHTTNAALGLIVLFGTGIPALAALEYNLIWVTCCYVVLAAASVVSVREVCAVVGRSLRPSLDRGK